MSWKDKTFKEKKIFYKERQVFFDAVKHAREGDRPQIKYSGKLYELVSPDSFWDYVEEKRQGTCVVFSKKYKSNTIVWWWYSDKNGFRFDTENGIIGQERRDKKSILCFAEEMQ